MLLLTAAAAYGVARWLRLPTIPLLIFSGMALDLTGLVPAELGLDKEDSDVASAYRILQVGLAFLVFASGVELNPRRFANRSKTVAWVAVLQFLVCALIGYVTARWLGYGGMAGVYIGCSLAVSSTLVVLRQLRARQTAFEPFGRVVTGVLLVQDFMLVVLLVVLSRWDAGAAGVGGGLGGVLVLGGIAWVAQQRVIPLLLRRFKPDEESLLLWLAAVLFGFLGLAGWLDLPFIAGAFLGGFAFSAFPLNGLVRGKLSSLSEFFQALFFVALGALVGVPEPHQLVQALKFSAVVLLMTPPLVAAIAEWRGLNRRASIESGLLLAQTSEYSLLLGLSGLMLGHLTADAFSVIALTTLITMTLTPFIGQERVALALLPLHPFHPFRRKRPPMAPLENHVLVLGFGSAGMWTVKPLRAQGEQVLVVDDDAVVCRELRRMKIPNLRGDGADEETLEHAGASRAKLIIISMRRVGDAIKVLDHIKGVPAIVRVLEADEAKLVEAHGGIPVLNSEAAAETFMEWFANTSRLGGPADDPPTPAAKPG